MPRLRLKTDQELKDEFGVDYTKFITSKDNIDREYADEFIKTTYLPHTSYSLALKDKNGGLWRIPSKLFEFYDNAEKAEVLSKLTYRERMFYFIKRSVSNETAYCNTGQFIINGSTNVYYDNGPTGNCQLSSIGYFESLFYNFSNEQIIDIVCAIRGKFGILSPLIFVDVKDRNDNIDKLAKLNAIFINKYESTNGSKMIAALLQI